MAADTRRILNPLAFHIQKWALELKCPLCLNLLISPMLLPCDHIFCNLCVPSSTLVRCQCPQCQLQYADQEIRAAPHMERMIGIYRSLNATFNNIASQSKSPDAGRSLEQSPISVNADDKSGREQSVKVIASSNDLNKEINRHNGDGMPLPGVKHLNFFPSSERSEEEIDLNQLQQQSPGSPLSPDKNNVIVKETSELTERITDIKSHSAKRSVEDSSAVVVGLVSSRVRHDNVSHERDVKRQKKQSYRLSETSLHTHVHNQQRDSSSEIIANSDCNLTCKLSAPFAAQPKAVIEHLSNGSVCAFCRSAKITEGTGKMLYYANGREVEGVATSLSKVISVHSKCIDWAPQVYYDGDTIKNLEAELARAAKLNCSGCGRKGAALGCLVKSCQRSYHMPCASAFQDCRWDCDDFVMLCPSHKSVRFPSEKSKSGKREVCPVSAPPNKEEAIPSMPLACRTSEQSKFWATSSDGPKAWVLCGSAVSEEEKYMLIEFAKMCGATVCKSWKPNVTHVIAATDKNGACSRTLKYLMAILSGKWILTIDWIRACIEAKGPVNEEPYEISLDNHSCFGGPKAGRLRASANAPKLFDGFKFYIEYETDYKCDLVDLVKEGGGYIIATEESLARAIAMQESRSAFLVVYNLVLPSDSMSGEESNINLQRQAEAEDLAKQIGGQAISQIWILESIAACKLAPFC